MPVATATTTVETLWDPFAESACKIAMTYFDLATPSLGLGSCWNGYFNRAVLAWEPLDQMTNYGAMMVGYPKFKYSRMPTRNAPRITWME